MTLLLSLAILAAASFIFFQLGKRHERNRIHRQLKAASKQLNDYSLQVLPALELMKADTAKMMREMEFYGEEAERCNARGGAA